jgi:hypothetical protein
MVHSGVVLTAGWLKVQVFWDVLCVAVMQGYWILMLKWNVRSVFETSGTADLVTVRCSTQEVLGPEHYC